MSAEREPLPGIGGYKVERELGSGGMGKVYLCRDETLDRKVAIKVLLPELLEQEEMRVRFLREARALARVSSPHVVAVHAVGEDPGSGPFVVMEYLEGEDLLMRLNRDGRIPWREAVRVARDAVLGLRAAQEAGIVHRDIKPANLFVVNGKAKLTDFGLAREIAGTGSGVTQAGMVVGTPAYLAPEVIKGLPATHQSDLYSLGATIFHLIAGRPPFLSDAPLEVVAQAIKEEPPALSSVVDVPATLDTLISRMLRKAPEDRPQGWPALEADLAFVDAVAGPLTSGASGPHRTMTFGSPPMPAPVPASAAPPAITSVSEMPTQSTPMPPASSPMSSTSGFAGPTVSNPFNVVLTSGELALHAPKIKTATLTVMMTDIAGYTERTSRVSREESARWLALHDHLLQPVFRSFGGRVVKTLGDAFLVTFSSPTDAVLSACAIQDRLWLHNRGARSEDTIHVRIALSAGEVRLHKGDVFGEPVNLAARLEGVAQPGEVLVSDAVYATMNAAEVKLTSRGEHQLKGIPRPVMVYAAVPDNVIGSPPFGGRALAHVKETASVVDDLVANAPHAFARFQTAAAPVLAFALKDKRAWAGAAATLALVIAILVASLVRDDRIDRIERGQARVVAAEIEQVPEIKRSPRDWEMLGHARIALDDGGGAFTAFRRAVEKGDASERIKAVCFKWIEKREHKGAAEVLAAWPDHAIDGELKKRLEGDEWWPRHHAMGVLDQRKLLTDDQRVAVGLKDLTSDVCGDRRLGMQILKKYGRGPAVLAALKKLADNPGANLCMFTELGAAQEAVRKRSELQ